MIKRNNNYIQALTWSLMLQLKLPGYIHSLAYNGIISVHIQL